MNARPKRRGRRDDGAGAFASTPQSAHRQAKRRWRMTYGLTGGISISSYSPINSLAASDAKAPPHCSHTLGVWSRTHRDRPQADGCAAHAPASPRRAESFALFLFVRRGRLRRRARIPIGSLKLEHQLDQLLFAQVLQISAVHRPKDLEIDAHGKGVGNCKCRPVRPGVSDCHDQNTFISWLRPLRLLMRASSNLMPRLRFHCK